VNVHAVHDPAATAREVAKHIRRQQGTTGGGLRLDPVY
jgi:hypothetical protein